MGNHHQLGGRGARPSFQSQRRFFSNPTEKKPLFKEKKCASTDSSKSGNDFLSKLFALLNSVVKEFSSTTNSTISAGRLSKLFSTAVPFAMALSFSMIKGATGAEICMQFVNNFARVNPDKDSVADAFAQLFGVGDVSEFSCSKLNQTAARLQSSALHECSGLLRHNLYGDTTLEVTNGLNLPEDYEGKVCLKLQKGDGILFFILMGAIVLTGVAILSVCCGKRNDAHTAHPLVGVAGGGGNHHHPDGANHLQYQRLGDVNPPQYQPSGADYGSVGPSMV